MDVTPRADGSVPIHFIDENPVNNVISSPDGRVFINVNPVISEALMGLIGEAIAAKMAGDQKKLHAISGAKEVLMMFSRLIEMLQTQAIADFTEKVENGA